MPSIKKRGSFNSKFMVLLLVVTVVFNLFGSNVSFAEDSTYQVSGVVWWDQQGGDSCGGQADGLRQATELRLAKVKVELYVLQGPGTFFAGQYRPLEMPMVTWTDDNGEYNFENVPAGDYKVVFHNPGQRVINGSTISDYAMTAPNVNGNADDDIDSDIISSFGSGNFKTDSFILDAQKPSQKIDGGLVGYCLPNTMTYELGDFVWQDDNRNGVQDPGEPGIAGVEVNLSGNGVNQNATTDSSGKYKFYDLDEGVYTLTFTMPSGYTETKKNATTDNKDSDGLVVSDFYLFGNDNSYDLGLIKDEKIDIKVTKVWQPAWAVDLIRQYRDPNFANSCTIKLIANGQDTGKSITLDSSNETGYFVWQGQFEDIAKFDDNGDLITYTVEEEQHDCYSSYVSGSAEKGFIVTNEINEGCYTVESPLSIYKRWEDNNNEDGKRPDSITLHVTYNPGADHLFGDQIILNADNGWGRTVYINEQIGNVIGNPFQSITIEEEPVEGYKTEIAYDLPNGSWPELGSLTQITNVRVIDIVGQKTWNDSDNQDGKRPDSITIRLMNGTKQVASQVVTAADGWSWKFTDLPKYANGKAIDYTIKEDAVADYSTEIDGYDVINTYIPETIDIKGSKTWADDNDQDGKRPDSITIRLMNGTEEVASQVVTAEDGWSWKFSDLPKYANGKAIDYTIKEDAVADYSTKINGYDVTNTYTPEKTTVAVEKKWVGEATSSAAIQLFADGTKLDEVVLSSANNWQHTFANLDRYKAGKAIIYTIAETEIAGYSVAISGDATNGFVVTNTKQKDDTVAPTSKTYKLGDYVWDDSNKNGLQDPAEKGVAGVKVVLKDDTGKQLAETYTKVDGSYLFTDLVKGEYVVEFGKLPVGYKVTKSVATDSAKDSNGLVVSATIEDADNTTIDLGIYKERSDNSGGNDTNPSDDTDTNPNGGSDANPGGSDDTNSSGADDAGPSVSNDNTSAVTNQKTYQIGNHVWFDDNRDGVHDATEQGVAGVKVLLLDNAGNTIAETTTDGDGRYLFTGLTNGDYKLQFSDMPADYQVGEVKNKTVGLSPSVTITNSDDLSLNVAIYKLSDVAVATPAAVTSEPQLPNTSESLPLLPITLGLMLLLAGVAMLIPKNRLQIK